MRRATLLLIVLAGPAGCGDEPPRGADADRAPDSPPPAEERVVVLRSGPLLVEPDRAAPGVADVVAGTLLTVVQEGADPAGDDWVRVATWDDRRGWIPASHLMEPGLFAHYGEALGGVSPILLRPAYPVEGERWGIEAPFHSPGFTPASTAWLLGDPAVGAEIAEIDTLDNVCAEERHRFAVTRRAARADHLPFLAAGVIATPSGSRPSAERLAVRPLTPDPALAALARRADVGPPGAGPPASIEWAALGAEGAWAALSWPAEDPETGRAQLAAALLFRRGPESWEPAGTLPLTPSSAEIPTPAWRPVAVYATGAGRATLLLLEGLEYEGAHLDIWIERGDGFLRLYEGYYWGC